MLLVVIPVAWLALLVLGIAVCRLASSSDASEARAEREWAFASWKLFEDSRNRPLAEGAAGEHDRDGGLAAQGGGLG